MYPIINKKDILLISCILVLGIVFLLIFCFLPKTDSTVHVTVDGKDVQLVDLHVNQTVPIVTQYGENIIQIQNGKVSVIDANCKNHICKNHYAISHNGETIVCLPHHLVISIQKQTTSDPDIVI